LISSLIGYAQDVAISLKFQEAPRDLAPLACAHSRQFGNYFRGAHWDKGMILPATLNSQLSLPLKPSIGRENGNML
jgi:hypothetical protein